MLEGTQTARYGGQLCRIAKSRRTSTWSIGMANQDLLQAESTDRAIRSIQIGRIDEQ